MKIFPESALHQLEFDKIRELLCEHCTTEFAKQKAIHLRIHTKHTYIVQQLQQSNEFKILHQSGLYFPNDFKANLHKELTLLAIPGSTLAEEHFILIKKLLKNTADIFRWFNSERRTQYAALTLVISESYYEKVIAEMIDEIIDETGQVKDNASEELATIRMKLYRKRNEQRKIFDKIAARLNKLGYLADIEESFMNGRRVLAVFAEQKRMIKGILHAESDSRRTSFIEPEETTALNNEIFSLENEESREVNRILRALTSNVRMYADLLKNYLTIAGEFDFIRAKALLAIEMNASFPSIVDKAHIELRQAYHPLLFLMNKRSGKETVAMNLTLNDRNRILVISGPNAGGKTVTMKTIGLNQLMMQSGLLVPLHQDSVMGIFKQLMIHMGDTQSLEFELSTYSSHLKNMKYFMENANGKTLFFIDELGSGSDPNLGGAFAEVIMEELAHKHSTGVVTTHYLNLKVMANKVSGIMNGAMQFDETRLMPMYKLMVGKPGSSYTFSIAERIGLEKRLIEKARKLVDENHFMLDNLLNRTEQDLQKIDDEKKELNILLKDNERLKKEMQQVISKEKHRQQLEILQQQNLINAEKISYLKDTERKLKAMVVEWRKTEDKQKVLQNISALLFKQRDKNVSEKQQKKINEKYQATTLPITVGAKVSIKRNHQIGIVKELRGKKAIVQLGAVPITIITDELTVVIENEEPKVQS